MAIVPTTKQGDIASWLLVVVDALTGKNQFRFSLAVSRENWDVFHAHPG